MGGILIPQDVLIHQILVLLPVISLLRFKSVCKSWRALIQSSLFVHLHLNTLRPSNNNNFGTFIFQTSNYVSSSEESKYEAFMLSSGSGSGEKEEEEDDDNDDDELQEEEFKWEDLGFPLPPRYKVHPTHDIFMVGSCNGLICIHDTKPRGDVSLWNPATRQFRLLPKSLTPLEEEIPGNLKEDFVAFGYDVKTKDYKVVQISHFRPYMSGDRWLSVKEYIFRVQVYSLTTDSWRLLEGINSLPAFPIQARGLNHGVYLNGSYYFLGDYRYEFEIENITQVTTGNMILSFDFTKEIFTTIQLPHDYPLNTMLTCFGEKLAVFAALNVKDEPDFETYDIWVLNEHGMKESWTKLHSTVPYSIGRPPRGISNNGEFALIATGGSGFINDEYVFSTKRLLLFNLVTKEVKKEFPTGDDVTRAFVYKQSLVSIGGNDAVADKVIGGCRSWEYQRVLGCSSDFLMPSRTSTLGSMESHSATDLEVSTMLETSPTTLDNQVDT